MKEVLKKLNIEIKDSNNKLLIYKNNELVNVLTGKQKSRAYNYVFDWENCVDRIRNKGKDFFVFGRISFPFEINNLEDCSLVIGNDHFPIELLNCVEDGNWGYCINYVAKVNVMKITSPKKIQGVYIRYSDGTHDLVLRAKWRYIEKGDSIYEHPRKKIMFSKIIKEETHTFFFYQTAGNYLSFMHRDENITDKTTERIKIWSAKLLSYGINALNRKQKIVFFEKFCSAYEESAAVLFEYCIDKGIKNIVYILEKDIEKYSNVSDEYKKYIVPKYSFRHYLHFFTASAFISTESMNHAVELNIYNSSVRKRIRGNKYNYIFLQHGVMYMYSLKNRGGFIKGNGMPNNTKIVVSSQLEAEHLKEFGKYREMDMIYSGLPKFDRAYREADADKIVIMPTSRDFEYNIIKNNTTASKYYGFVKRIIGNIPNELEGKVVFVPHPLVRHFFAETDLEKYIPHNFSYNEILKCTKLLITDYSSISYDAFFRGCNVLFCWEEKEYCLAEMGYSLMLNEENVFGDISQTYNDLTQLIHDNYYSEQSEKNKDRYRQLVEHNDRNNCKRCYDSLCQMNIFKNNNRKKLKASMAFGITSKLYSGHRKIQGNHYMMEKNTGQYLVKGKDYNVFHFNCKKAGTAHVIFLGRGHYKGLVKHDYNILKDINYVKIKFDKNSGDIIVEMDGKTLIKNQDYSIKEEIIDNITKITVKGKGDYGGKKYLFIESY